MVKIEAADLEPPVINSVNSDIKQTSTELVAFNENQEIQYQGYCKLQINIVSKFLKVNPVNENFLDITATFDWKFIKQRNIIFVFAKHVSQDLALIFNDEEKCQKVLNGIFKKRENKDSVDKEELQKRFMIPIFKKIPKNGPSRLKELMKKWIRKHDNEKEKKEYFQLLNEHQAYDVKDVKQEIDSKPRVYRKRRRDHQIKNYSIARLSVSENNNHLNDIELQHEENSDHEEVAAKRQKIFSSHENIKIIDESKFRIVNVKYQNGFRRKLLIFTKSAKIHCYEFNFVEDYFCHCCDIQKKIKAIFTLNENGNDCIKLEDEKHNCSPIQYDPEKYIEIKIVKKSDYKIIENYPTESKRRLIIFDSNDKNQCYEYYWESARNIFRCCGCAIQNKFIFAEIVHENTVAEYIRLLNDGHICIKRKYSHKKYSEFYKYVLLPNFKIQIKIKDGIELNRLIIFDESNQKLCYSYYKRDIATNVFYCLACRQKKNNVSARIYKNSDGEDYVILSNVKHVCSPQTYIPQNILIFRPPEFKFFEATEIHKSKFFIFDSKNPNLSYTFTNAENGSKRYYCLGCQNKSRYKNTKNQKNVTVIAYLYKDDSKNGEYYVKMMDGQRHICKPKKYEPEKFERKVLKPKDDYVLFRRNDARKGSLGLAIFLPNDKNLCFKYYYSITNKRFRCRECEKEKTHISAKICQDSDENEYLIINQKKHVCKPIKVSSIINSVLEKSGLVHEEKPKKKKEIDENRIIRLPNFELQQNNRGIPDRKLIVFQNDGNEKMCYIYGYRENIFLCKKCHATAKLQSNGENGETYVVMDEKKHLCEAMKYDPEMKIEFPNFMVFNKDDESKITKMVIFTSSEKNDCYEYSFYKRNKCFRCCACLKNKKKTVSAKLVYDPNGEEYVQLLQNDHICTPKKFVLEEFQPKIVPEIGFKLFSNVHGKLNSKLIIFDSKKDNSVYEYLLTRNNIFTCNSCIKMKQNVTAKLREKENGEKYLELSLNEHICESRKYDSKKLNEKKTVFENFVVQHNKSGVPKSRLTIFNGEDKNLGYQYSINQTKNGFYCCGCSCFQKVNPAKLMIDKDGKEYIEFGNKEHCCSVRNLKKKNLIFDKFNLKEKALITNALKNKYYKFEYDSDLDAFCCVKCKEEKKIITATICKNKNDGKEFILLNDTHGCVSLKK